MLIGYIPLNTDSEDEPLWERKLLQCFTCKLSIYTWQHSIRTFIRIMYLSVDALFHSLRFLQRRSRLHWNFLVLKMDSSVWKFNGLMTGLSIENMSHITMDMFRCAYSQSSFVTYHCILTRVTHMCHLWSRNSLPIRSTRVRIQFLVLFISFNYVYSNRSKV
jgi:hypothetical protein